jgi:hypothetical protein
VAFELILRGIPSAYPRGLKRIDDVIALLASLMAGYEAGE